MQRTLIKEIEKELDSEIRISGWVYTKRDHGKITFIDLRDRSGIVQVVGKGEDFVDLTPESVVEIIGKVKKRPENLINPNSETGHLEIEAKEVVIIAKAGELPFDMSRPQLDLQLPTLLDFRTLTLRHARIASIFKVQEAIMEGFRNASKKLDCTEIFVPTIAASSTEGGAEVFKFPYYEHEAFLIQSPQLYKQMLVPVFERVFLVSHVYRAEPSVTTRHLSESIQLDCEFGFVGFEELLDYLEFMGLEILNHVENECKEILKDYKVEKFLLNKNVPRLTMREAQEIILKRKGVDHRSEPDLMPEDEREICIWAKEEKNSDFVTITHFPTKKRAFYTAPDPKDPHYSLSFDLLFKGVEILSGSQRISDYGELVAQIEERGMKPEDFEMYLQAFKYGMPPEGGFSFGLERMTMQILNLANIREASLYPRDMERVDLRFSKKANA
jgi:nondiscriminating aspartyl-tRNA synthetase